LWWGCFLSGICSGRSRREAALRGVNAAVAGLLLAAFYDPVWIAGILNKGDYALATAAFLLLFVWKTPPYLVLLACVIARQAMAAI
jgi:chromate transporter